MHRAGLPVKLVILIFRLSGITIPEPKLGKLIATPFSVMDLASDKPMHLWIEVPIDANLLHKLAKVRLITFSGHQGWATVSQSTSWFELAILSRSASEVRCLSTQLLKANMRYEDPARHFKQVRIRSMCQTA